jgi:hypothetical protein
VSNATPRPVDWQPPCLAADVTCRMNLSICQWHVQRTHLLLTCCLCLSACCSYFNHQSLCWAGKVKNGCFENTSSLGEPVTGLDLHNGTEVANSSEYSTTLYTTEAARIIAAHAEHGVMGTTGGRHVPLFLYLPHQAVHVGNLPEESHPEYARDQAPPEYIERFQHIEDEQRRNLSAMVVCLFCLALAFIWSAL